MNSVDALAADEYRKTIGKDAALERRFQPVTIEEPTVESTISILRGLKPRYEVCLYACSRRPCAHMSLIQVHHGVEISDGALVTGLWPFMSSYLLLK
jgi:ATP-dependent Clp protease ATP-binding subunit ClpB